jgi:hypothetical protein
MQPPRLTISTLAVLAIIAVAVCGFSRTGFAQLPPPPIDAPSTKGVAQEQGAGLEEILKITLPKAAESDLKNGLHLIVLEDHRLPQISFQLFIPGAGGY